MNQNNQTTDFNPYQYTRTVRFRAEPRRQSKCFKKKSRWSDTKADLGELSELLLEAHRKLKELLCYKDAKGKFTKQIQINKSWLKRWHKDVFYLFVKKGNNDGKYALGDLKDLHEDFQQRLDNWREVGEWIKDAHGQTKDSRFRRSDVAYHIRGLMGIDRLQYFQSLLAESHTQRPELHKKLEELINDLEKVQEKLKSVESEYIPAQSDGLEIAKASFNYYTVNKKPIEGYEKTLQDVEKDLHEKPFSTIESKSGGNYIWGTTQTELFQFKSEQEKEWRERYFHSGGGPEGKTYLSLDETYKAMKAFKAEQKSIFYEVMAHVANGKNNSYKVRNDNHKLKDYEFNYTSLNFEGINKAFSLFNFKEEDKYRYFIEKTQEINKHGNKELQQQRLFGNNCYFRNYRTFCEHYKKIAQKRGKTIAQRKGIEKERQEAIQTDYWAIIYSNQGERDKKQLWLVPKDKMQEAREFIYGKPDEGNSDCLYYFESLTMRALHKLCFAEQSSFVEGMGEKLKRLQKDAKEFKTDGDKTKMERKDSRKLDFLKKILKSDYARERLHLQNFRLDSVHRAKSLEDFETALEDSCYHVGKTALTEKEKQAFIDDFDVSMLDITSYDLEGRNKNTHQTPASENRRHTNLWQDLWSYVDGSSKKQPPEKTRLNPEVKIRYRKTDKEIKDYITQTFNPRFKHRRLEPQFTAAFTLALNAGKKYEKLAFAKPEELLEKIDDFNNKLNKSMNFNTAWKYGIDRGNIELATLCLAKFNPDKETYTENNKDIVKPTFPKGEQDIKCLALKNYLYSETYTDGKRRQRERKAINNLSYFIDNTNLFKEQSVTCLDLTTAKAIKGKIVAEGDVITYLKLKKTVAKRKIYETASQIDGGAKLEWSTLKDGKQDEKNKRPEGVLNVRLVNGEEKTVYEYRKKHEDILPKKQIEIDLNRYLNEIKRKNHTHTPSIEQINNLRDSITANMVGVISHLQKTYPGFIILEDLSEGEVERQFLQSNENISRRLEAALYNKFQSLKLVPPHVKDIVALREKIREKQRSLGKQGEETLSSQIGAIVFVDKFGTSKHCPYCEASSKQENEWKFEQHRFICRSDTCGFDTYLFKDRKAEYRPEVKKEKYKEGFDLFKEIDDPDKVAAYNVAKKITDYEKIGKMELPKSDSENGRGGSKAGRSSNKRSGATKSPTPKPKDFENRPFEKKLKGL